MILHIKKPQTTSIEHCQESSRERCVHGVFVNGSFIFPQLPEMCSLSDSKVSTEFSNAPSATQIQRPNAYVCLGLLCQITSP